MMNQVKLCGSPEWKASRRNAFGGSEEYWRCWFCRGTRDKYLLRQRSPRRGVWRLGQLLAGADGSLRRWFGGERRFCNYELRVVNSGDVA